MCASSPVKLVGQSESSGKWCLGYPTNTLRVDNLGARGGRCIQSLRNDSDSRPPPITRCRGLVLLSSTSQGMPIPTSAPVPFHYLLGWCMELLHKSSRICSSSQMLTGCQHIYTYIQHIYICSRDVNIIIQRGDPQAGSPGWASASAAAVHAAVPLAGRTAPAAQACPSLWRPPGFYLLLSLACWLAG